TPLVRLRNLVSPETATVWVKCEQQNPGGSVKDRIALAMIEDAEREGRITPGKSVIVEPTSGNTGIGLALVCAVKRYKLILTLPANMSLERRAMLKAYGAELVLTEAERYMEGSVARAEELCKRPDHFMPQQFNNPANPEVHRRTTGPEIVEQMAGERIDAFIAGVGTGGTITGVGGGVDRCGRAGGLAGLVGRAAGPAQHPGHRRGLHPGRAEPKDLRRSAHGDRPRRVGNQAAPRQARGVAGGHLGGREREGCLAGRARARPRQERGHRAARYRRALLLARRIFRPGASGMIETRILIVGAGGLGSPAALALAESGVRTIGICDPDVVEVSNLHRQLLHTDADLG